MDEEGGSSEGTGNHHGSDVQVCRHLRVHGCVGIAFSSRLLVVSDGGLALRGGGR
jgi:hypothetical protein